MTIHIGILGGGNISETHARAVSELNGVDLTAICGQNANKVEQLAAAYGGKAYEQIDDFFRHKPLDLVLIGSPSGLHAEHGIPAARYGLHVLVEKPIGITLDQADSLIEACDRAKVKLGVFFQDRLAPDILRLKKLIDTGRVGKPILASARVKWHRPPDYYSKSRWRGTWGLDGGGALMNQGVHTIDLLLWLMGDVRCVWAKGRTALHDIEVEDTLVAAFEFSNGALGTLEAATSVYPGFPRRLEVTGSEGTIVVEGDRIVSAGLRTPLDGLDIEQHELGDQRQSSPLIKDISGHRKVIEDFLDAIANDRPACCDGREARRSVELVQAIYDSWRSGQPITLASAQPAEL